MKCRQTTEFAMRISEAAMRLNEDSIWRTWKPYAAIAAVLAGGIWWHLNLSSFATPRDGLYKCQPVFVASDGKYQIPVDSEGNYLPMSSATVRDGALVSFDGVSDIAPDRLSSVSLRSKGISHFHFPDSVSPRGYYAVACDYAGG